MSKIVVLGKEEFVMGFELVGIESSSIEKLDELLSKSTDVGIIIIPREDFDNLSIKLQNMVSKVLKPIVIILSKDDLKGNVLREKVIRAMGVDLLK